MKFFFIFLFGTVAFFTAFAQSDAKSKVLVELANLSSRFRSADHLSFNVDYRYSDEANPMNYLDSLHGKVQMNGPLISSVLDSTVSIQFKDYGLVLFKEDNLMMISKDNGKRDLLLSGIDTGFFRNDSIRYSILEEENIKKIIIEFPLGQSCRKLTFDIDKYSGFVSKMCSVINSKHLYDPEFADKLGELDSYAIVEVRYSQFSERSFSDEIFNPAKYFKKVGTEYLPTPAFNNYKIFLSSPNL